MTLAHNPSLLALERPDATSFQGAARYAQKRLRRFLGALIDEDDAFACWSLWVMYDSHPDYERRTEQAYYRDGVGYGKFDAKVLLPIGESLALGRRPTSADLANARKVDRRGNVRLAKYWRQILEHVFYRWDSLAEEHQAAISEFLTNCPGTEKAS